jgi:hypothetical protein
VSEQLGPMQPADPSGIDVYSGVSAKTGFGFVTLRWGDQHGQLTPDDARRHALSILAAAEAAEHDSAVFAVISRTLAKDGESVSSKRVLKIAGRFLEDLRAERREREEVE